MRQRNYLYPAVISCVAAISFASGRLSPPPAKTSDCESAEEASRIDERAPLPTPIAVPDQLPNVVAMTFTETYALLKAASPDTVRSYYNELIKLRPNPTRRATLATFFKTLVHINPALTKELILALKGDDRWTALFAIREAAPPRGMSAVAEVFLSYDRAKISSCSWDMLADTLEEWGRNDPQALKQFLETHRDQDVERYFPKLVRSWAAFDPEAAQKWLTEQTQNHPPPPEGDENWGDGWTATVEGMLTAWLEGYLENDTEAAIQYILDHPTYKAVTAALRPLGGDLFMIASERAREFVLQLAEEQRAETLQGIADKADRFVTSDSSDNRTSPRFIAEWLRTSFHSEWEEHLEHVLIEWKYGNPQELFAWILDLPAIDREAVVRRFPTYVSNERPREDFDLIMQIRDPVLRDQLLERLARGADTSSEREAILPVFESSELPAPQRVHLASLVPLPRENFVSSENEAQ